MAIEFKLPEIGEGVAEGEIIKWLVAEGDEVSEDTPLVEVMTDKATVEVPSPRAGKILEIKAHEGEIIEIGTVMMLFSEDAQERTTEAPPEPESNREAEPTETSGRDPQSPEPVDEAIEAARAMARAELEQMEPGQPERVWEAPPAAPGRALASPATRRLARELEVDLLRVPGTGKGGRITKDDVTNFAGNGSAAAKPEAAAPEPVAESEVAVVSRPAAEQTVSGVSTADEETVLELEERVPVRGLRRLIVEKMSQAKRIIPHFTYVEECDMTEIVALRNEAKQLGAAQGVKVTFLPFIVQALVAALKQHPTVNSSFDEEAGEIVIKRYYNIGIATASDRGLMVPVVQGADRRGVFDLAREIARVTGDARQGKSQLEDLRGGTFTITSTGNVGGLQATPIINHPEVAILGVAAIRKRPVVRDDEIVIRDMVNLSLSLDHRIVDGYDGAVFLRDMIVYLEDPKLLLLGAP